MPKLNSEPADSIEAEPVARAYVKDVLEFGGLCRLLGRYVQSPLGAAELEKVEPVSDRGWLELALPEVSEAMEYARASAQPQPASRGAAVGINFGGIPEVAPALALLRIEGAALEGRQLFELASLLERSGDIRAILNAATERFPLLGAKAARMMDPRALLRELRGKVLPDGGLADDASPALHRLRRDIERQRKEIQISLERFLRKHHEDGILQEEFVTLRNDRFVVPVIAGQQGKVQGVIHGASSSGHTLFVEPLETIELNNQLVRLREEELREQQRIFLELTEMARQYAGPVQATAEVLGEIDLLFAKAAFAADFDCVVPRFSGENDRKLMLREARHPLLQDILRAQKKTVVPISPSLDEKSRTLLISGPNTGGKTVSLKTAGLLSLMAQAAIPVPAAEAVFPLFERVLADFGDNQSIQESLSTFSAHITHIREMLIEATRDTLVLLDELGRATDPEEGGPLGAAILENFWMRGAFTLASTHLMALKIYGASTQGVVNASVGFDEATLQPTYVLRLGAPGKSAGLEIASRLGLPEFLIARARGRMTNQERDIAQFLSDLHQRLDRVAETERVANERLDELEKRANSLAKEWEQRERAKLRELEERFAREVEWFEAHARETLERIEAEAAQRKATSGARAQRKVAEVRREFQDRARAVLSSAAPEAAGPGLAPIEEGSRVRLKGIREPARVRRKLSDGRLEVEAGWMRLQIPMEDVEEVLPPAPAAAGKPANVSYQPGPAWNVSYREINVIGQRAEEAREQVDKFLDSAALASVDRVRIVHGHGMGILKKAIAELLQNHPHVEKFYPATPAEGGTGATIVELK